MHHKWKGIIDFVCSDPVRHHKGSTSSQIPIELKDKSSIQQTSHLLFVDSKHSSFSVYMILQDLLDSRVEIGVVEVSPKAFRGRGKKTFVEICILPYVSVHDNGYAA